MTKQEEKSAARAHRRLRGKRGASLVEHGLLIGLIAVAGIGAISATGTTVRDVYCKVTDAIGYRLYGTQPQCLTDSELASMFGNLAGAGGALISEDERPGTSSLSRVFGEDSWGEQHLWAPIPAEGFPGEGPHVVRITPLHEDGPPVAACSGAGEARQCSAPSTGVSSQPIGADDTDFGYSITLPEDPRQGFEQTVVVEVVDANGNVVYSSQENVEKPAADAVYASVNLDLGHWDILTGTTGEYFIWAPVESFNAPFRVFLEEGTTGGVSQACVFTQEGEPTCENGGVTMVPGEHRALGFRIGALPPDTRVDADYAAVIGFDSLVDPSVTYDLDATASREPEPVVLSVQDIEFKDEIIPAGTSSSYAVREEMKGDFNGDMLFTMTVGAGEGYLYFDTCYWASENEVPTVCERNRDGVVVPHDAYAIGYRFRGITDDLDRPMNASVLGFELASVLKREIKHEWTEVDITRPQWEPQVAARSSCQAHYLAGESVPSYYPINSGGSEKRLYCHFETDGPLEGGWTVVAFQKDTDPVRWDEGVASGFHARADTQNLVSYALSDSQMPSHGSVAFGTHSGQAGSIRDAFDIQWTPSGTFNHSDFAALDPDGYPGTGRVESLVTGGMAGVVKNANHLTAGNHNPNRGDFSWYDSWWGETSVAYSTGAPEWAFIPGYPDSQAKIRGYSYQGSFAASRTEGFAYTIMVR